MSSSLLIEGIGSLATCDPRAGAGPLGVISDAAVVVEDGRFAYVGPTARAPAADRRLSAAGRCGLPGFVDAHTHLVFAGDRADDFVARCSGAPYRAGGILRTVAATRAASDAELRRNAGALANEALRQGTTTLETKSGYGLTTPDEVRSLTIANGVADEVTFLGAHALPVEYSADRDAYVALVAGEMLDACAPLCHWCDVFCDEGAFDEDEARTVLVAARRHGLGLRLHTGQLARSGGARLAAELACASADHLTHLEPADASALAEAGVVATLCPAAEFSTRSARAPARLLVDSGCVVALASDCNPGTSFTTSMPFVVALGVSELGLSPDEAVLAATVGGATALRRQDIGRVVVGGRGDLVLLDAPSHVHLAYRPGVDLVSAVVRSGEVFLADATATAPSREDAGRG